jgi:hypothetical protein
MNHSPKQNRVVLPLPERLRKDGSKLRFDVWMLKPGDSIPASRRVPLRLNGANEINSSGS